MGGVQNKPAALNDSGHSGLDSPRWEDCETAYEGAFTLECSLNAYFRLQPLIEIRNGKQQVSFWGGPGGNKDWIQLLTVASGSQMMQGDGPQHREWLHS